MYLVRHVPTDQLRAVKRLKADAPKRRMRELDVMKHLRHPALPQVFDVIEDGGAVWLVMEYINGKTLAERARFAGTPEGFFSVARQLADVLCYLHTRKQPILHLDIKPSNILLRQDGGLVLLDFGAAVREHAAGKDVPCFGTPGFAAPEQLIPGAGLDCRTDFYGFGAVLYYCLYGEVPRTEESCARKLQSDRLFWRRSVAPLLRRCLAKEKGRRFSDTRALCRQVEKLQRRYAARRARRKSVFAAMFLLAVLFFSAVNLRWEDMSIAMTEEVEEKYEALLGEAEGLGFAQAVSCYEEAAALCPDDSAWCASFLDRIGADYSFNAQEEIALKRLLFSSPGGNTATAEELLADSSPEYGELAYRIGLLYWYFYEGAGGRNAAARWFGRAVASQDGDGMQAAEIYLRIGAYCETLGKQDIDGNRQADVGVYWNDLSELWSLDEFRQEPFRVQCEAAGELLSLLIMQISELEKDGVSAQQIGEMLESIETFAQENSAQGELAALCLEQCETAREAVERAILQERRAETDAERET